jgi:BirA family biotin operon repressor/biotin-[acetyl-CoA-carboxylase] ligase
MARRGAPDGALVLADEQTAGRGRRGRTWNAPPGQCLLCSLILRPTIPPRVAPRLTMLAAVAIARTLRALGAHAVVKWPNDVLITGRKVAGILAETELSGDSLSFAIVGMGVNIAVPAADLPLLAPQATSLLAETGHSITVPHVLRLLLAEVEARYSCMAQDDGQAIYEEWRGMLDTIGRDVAVMTEGDMVRGRAEDVDADGALLVRQDNGEMVRITFGEVA